LLFRSLFSVVFPIRSGHLDILKKIETDMFGELKFAAAR